MVQEQDSTAEEQSVGSLEGEQNGSSEAADFLTVDVEEAWTQQRYTIDLEATAQVCAIQETVAEIHDGSAAEDITVTINGHICQPNSLVRQTLVAVPEGEVPLFRVRFTRRSARRIMRPFTSPVAGSTRLDATVQLQTLTRPATTPVRLKPPAEQPMPTPAWMGAGEAPGGGLPAWPFPVGVFPRAASRFPADIRTGQEPAQEEPWAMNRSDGWTAIGHWAATVNPYRDVSPKRRLRKKLPYERRFASVESKYGRGHELKRRFKVRSSYDWESRWDSSRSQGCELPEYDAFTDPHLKHAMFRKGLKNMFTDELGVRVQKNTRNNNETTHSWIARLVKEGKSTFRMARVGNQHLT